MNAALCLTTLLAAVCLSKAVNPEFKQKFGSSVVECMKKYNLDKDEVMAIMREEKLPEDKEKQCAVGCVMDKMEYIKDLTMDWGKLKADNPHKFDIPEQLEKANQVMDTCAKTVTAKGTDLCQLGVDALMCIHEQADKVQLQRPEFSFE